MATATAEQTNLTELQLPADPLYVIAMEINNFKGIRAFRRQLDGKPLKLSGPNGAGKTSVIDATLWCLKPSAIKEVTEPVYHGAKECSVTLDLGELIVSRTQKADGRLALKVCDKHGVPIKKPQETIDSLYSHYCLDITKFLTRRPQDKIDDMLAVCRVTPPVREVLKIIEQTCEIDTLFRGDEKLSLQPRADESANQYLIRLSADPTSHAGQMGLFYSMRRDANGKVEDKRAAINDQRTVLEALGGRINGQQEESATELLAEIDRFTQQQTAKRSAEGNASDAKRLYDEKARALAERKGQLKAAQDECGRIEAEIARLQKQLELKLAEAADFEQRVAAGEGIVNDLARDYETAKAAAMAMPDVDDEITARRAKLATIEQLNKTIIRRRHVTEQVDALAMEYAEAQANHKRLDDILGRLRDLRKHLLDGIDLGVPELTIGDGELRLRGAPFEQASTGESYRVAFAVAVRQNPRLRLVRADEFEHLTAKSRDIFFALCREFRVQPFICVAADTENDELCGDILDGEFTPIDNLRTAPADKFNF